MLSELLHVIPFHTGSAQGLVLVVPFAKQDHSGKIDSILVAAMKPQRGPE